MAMNKQNAAHRIIGETDRVMLHSKLFQKFTCHPTRFTAPAAAAAHGGVRCITEISRWAVEGATLVPLSRITESSESQPRRESQSVSQRPWHSE